MTEQPVIREPIGYTKFSESSPCKTCAAHCCKMILIPYDAPQTFMQMDYVQFMLGFPGIKMVLNSDGKWQVKIEATCNSLDPDTNQCKVHGSEEQPKTCVYYNPFSCWYKRNYHNQEKPDIIEMDIYRLNILKQYVTFSEDGNIVAIPSWDKVRTLLNAHAG